MKSAAIIKATVVMLREMAKAVAARSFTGPELACPIIASPVHFVPKSDTPNGLPSGAVLQLLGLRSILMIAS
jgi:hypothetical protein